MKKRYRYAAMCILLMASMLLCGAGRFSIVTLDTDKYALYENVTAESLLQEYDRDGDAFRDKYDKQHLVVWGCVGSITGGGQKLKIAPWDGSGGQVLVCTTKDSSVARQVNVLQNGAPVKVYVDISVGLLTRAVNLTIVKVESAENMEYSEGTFTGMGGYDYHLDNMTEVEIPKGNVRYYIPESWKAVENSVDNERVYGYQYCLNEIGMASSKAESLFVFYFDSDKCLKNPNDKTKTQEIQVAIVNNILKKDPGTAVEFTRTGYETYYGAKYNYYNDTYTSPQNETYRVEFVFQSAGTKGVLVYMYVVHNDNEVRHLDDIMMVMRNTRM